MVPTTFVVCLEPGSHRLEYKGVALFASMRRNMGAWSGAPVWAYSPRPANKVSTWCRELLDHYEIRLIEEPLNTEWADYPLANKPLTLAHAETSADTPYVTFLDTDILVWREPTLFALAPEFDIALVADFTKTTASRGPGDAFEEYWERLYTLAGTTNRPFVETTFSREWVRGTWNSGVIALRRSSGIAAQWRDAMVRMLRDDFAPPQARYLRENNLLSAIASAHFQRLQQLPIGWNYPVHNWQKMLEYHGVAAEDAVLWHYQPFFDKVFARFEERISRAGSARERIKLTESLVDDLRRNYSRRIGLDETWVASWRRRARLGPRIRALLGRSKPGERPG